MVKNNVIRVLIADDHKLFRDGLKVLINNKDNLEVVGEASTGKSTIELIEKLKPDVVLMDIKMPVMDGIEATRQISKFYLGTKILALAAEASDLTIRQAMTAGIAGFMLKESAFDDLAEAIETVINDDQYLCSKTRSIMASSFKSWLQTGESQEEEGLTPQETEIIQLLSQGKSIGEIALSMNRSPKTIDARKRKTMSKLGITSMAELTKYAIKNGLATLDY